MRISDNFGWKIICLIFGALQLTACQTMPPPPRTGFTAEQIEVLESQGFQEVDGNYELGLENRILFEFDRSDLRSEVVAMLGKLSGVLTDVGIHGAQVEGHTDSEGAASYNQVLSLQRAEAVRMALAVNGIDYAAVKVEGRGETDPIASNDTAEGRQQNRRVVIIITALDAAPL